jgi:predicted metal-dependent TIM-barrel fold hydrolase
VKKGKKQRIKMPRLGEVEEKKIREEGLIMEEKAEKYREGLSRRGFLKAAGVMGAMAVAEKAMGQMPILVAANPLVGTFDMHVHAAPDVASRSVHDFDLAQKAKEMGMRGVVTKNHEFITNDRAYLVRQIVAGIEVFGGITLNYSVGGINPVAVDNMIMFTGGCGKIVWLPTHNAAHHEAFFTKKPDAGGIRVIDSSGNVIPELRKILKLVAKADIIFATGHVSPKEALAAAKAAKEEGVRKILITHAMQSPGEMTVDDLKRCLETGAIIEHAYLSYLMGPQAALGWMRGWKHVSMDDFAKAIKAVGADNCIISTDLGQYLNPTPADGLKEFILELKKKGITDDQINWMARKNPARLLGLEPM